MDILKFMCVCMNFLESNRNFISKNWKKKNLIHDYLRSKNKLASQKISVKKILLEKKFGLKNILVQNFLSPEILVKKNLRVFVRACRACKSG